MDVTTKCPNCGLMLALDTRASDEFECPQCRQRLTVESAARRARPVKRSGSPRRTATSSAPPADFGRDIDWSIPEIQQSYRRRKRRSVGLDPAIIWSIGIVSVCIMALVIGGVYVSRRGAFSGSTPPKTEASTPPVQQAPTPPPPIRPSEKSSLPAFIGPVADQAQQAQDVLAGRFGRERTLMVVGVGFSPTEEGELSDRLIDLAKRSGSVRNEINYNTIHSGGWVACVFAPIDDLDAFAKVIDFAVVAQTSPDQRRIYLTPKKQ
jgi:predicted RNA-binding Zn-ribbon protein involved in translation (DUF1610 family)